VTRVVVDPGVLVSALISPTGTAAQLYLKWLGGAFELVVSPHLLRELDKVLHRPKLTTTPDQVERYVEVFRRSAVMEPDAPQPWPTVTRDPKDDYLVALAHAVGVDAIISGDGDLISLSELVPPVIRPADFLAMIQKGR